MGDVEHLLDRPPLRSLALFPSTRESEKATKKTSRSVSARPAYSRPLCTRKTQHCHVHAERSRAYLLSEQAPPNRPANIEPGRDELRPHPNPRLRRVSRVPAQQLQPRGRGGRGPVSVHGILPSARPFAVVPLSVSCRHLSEIFLYPSSALFLSWKKLG